jgi:hypothetical protein
LTSVAPKFYVNRGRNCSAWNCPFLILILDVRQRTLNDAVTFYCLSVCHNLKSDIRESVTIGIQFVLMYFLLVLKEHVMGMLNRNVRPCISSL